MCDQTHTRDQVSVEPCHGCTCVCVCVKVLNIDCVMCVSVERFRQGEAMNAFKLIDIKCGSGGHSFRSNK